MFHVKHFESGLEERHVSVLIRQALGDAITDDLLPPFLPWERFALLATEMEKGASVLGLTGYKDSGTILTRLMAPALVAFRWLCPGEPLKVAEVGSGSGAMGLTLAIAAPAWRVYLLDRRRRATAFGEIVAMRLSVSNVVALTGDAANPPSGFPTFDAALFRAVKAIEEDLALARSFVRPGGRAIIWTSPSFQSSESPPWRLIEVVTLQNVRLSVRAFEHLGEN
jgi:16S rRNA G527 N7-methylase RsmG